MSRLRTRLTVGIVSAALTVPLTTLATASPASASAFRPTDTVGLVNGTSLVKFNVNRPNRVARVTQVQGLTGGDTELIGIDRRIQDNKLYGVGNEGGVYRIAPGGVARQVNRLTVPLEGLQFGVDFNPAADRLRIVSDTGQNLRHDITGTATPATVTDTALNYPATPTAPAVNPADGITAAAYTNNDLSTATGTSLFVADTTRDQLALQSPANAGILQSTGALGINARPEASFDIGKGNRGYAVLRAFGELRLYSVNLLTGKVTQAGRFPKNLQVGDLALPIR